MAANTCFNDAICNGGSGCGQYCDITNTSCQTAVLNYCAGTDNPSKSVWLSRWENNDCIYAIERNLFNSEITKCSLGYSQFDLACNSNIKSSYPLSTSGVQWASNMMFLTFQKYTSFGFVIGATPGTVGYNNLQNTFYGLCCNYPLVCQESLQNLCQIYNSTDLDNNLFASQFCGCNLPVTQYSTYSESYNIPPYCTPYCNRSNAIPSIDTNGAPIICEQSICVIDNTNYNLINAQINGAIDITQVCGNVGNGTNAEYSCIIDGNTFSVINSTFQNSDIVIEQVCTSTQCIIDNPGLTGPSQITVPCNKVNQNPYESYDKQLQQQQDFNDNLSYVLNIFIIAIVVLVIFLILFFK